MNLVEGLQEANNKSRKFLEELDETAKLMGKNSADDDPGLAMSKAATSALISQTETAIGSGDVTQMLSAAAAHGIGQEE